MADPNSINRTIGARVRVLREVRGLSPEALAAATRTSERYIVGIERGAGRVTVLDLDRLAHALRVTVRDLFPEEELTAARPTSTALSDGEQR